MSDDATEPAGTSMANAPSECGKRRYGRARTIRGCVLLYALIPGPDVGEIAVTIDDRSPVRLPLDGRPVRLFSSWRTGTHSVHIAAVAGQVGIDSVRVVETHWGWWWLAGLLAVAALSALASLAVRRHGRRMPGE